MTDLDGFSGRETTITKSRSRGLVTPLAFSVNVCNNVSMYNLHDRCKYNVINIKIKNKNNTAKKRLLNYLLLLFRTRPRGPIITILHTP